MRALSHVSFCVGTLLAVGEHKNRRGDRPFDLASVNFIGDTAKRGRDIAARLIAMESDDAHFPPFGFVGAFSPA